jgi:hypothetical protein
MASHEKRKKKRWYPMLNQLGEGKYEKGIFTVRSQPGLDDWAYFFGKGTEFSCVTFLGFLPSFSFIDASPGTRKSTTAIK